jgi:stage II sporulation protein D (peptidoglycan lytic transglycosylase)
VPPGGHPEPQIRVGLLVGTSSVSVGGGAALEVTQPDGTHLVGIPAGQAWRVVIAGQGLTLVDPSGGSSTPAEAVTIGPADQNDPVKIGTRDYHGTIDVLRDRTGLTAINRVGLEDYVGGVVGGEMGRRDSSEIEAVRAQAIVSRTYALRNLGRWRSQGFDFYPTVVDQVYGGLAGENPLGLEAVRDTRGMVITSGGLPIDAFFFSTCGGHTADGTEAFRGAVRPYLRSIADVAPSGVAYCSISPRYHWREEWSGDGLHALLDRTLRDNHLITTQRIGRVQGVRTNGYTRSGRVTGVTISTSGAGEIAVDAPLVRSVFRVANGDILRSTVVQLSATYRGGQVTRLVADGMGAGHGVGMCQWGAVGRARAGQRYDEILTAYFQGTELQRFY